MFVPTRGLSSVARLISRASSASSIKRHLLPTNAFKRGLHRFQSSCVMSSNALHAMHFKCSTSKSARIIAALLRRIQSRFAHMRAARSEALSTSESFCFCTTILRWTFALTKLVESLSHALRKASRSSLQRFRCSLQAFKQAFSKRFARAPRSLEERSGKCDTAVKIFHVGN